MQKNIDYNRFFEKLDISRHIKVEEDLGNGFVKLKISEAERRQALQDINSVEDIIIEILRNSRDAASKNIYIATKKVASKRRLIYCIDDGTGIPLKFHDLIFQSRVTSKLENSVKDNYGFHGRGMALFSIKLNVDEIKITYSDKSRGSCIYIDVDLEMIPEKKDQSILPNLIERDGSIEACGGVGNIIKTIIDFAIKNSQINIFFGNPTQIIATMIKNYKSSGFYKEYAVSAKTNIYSGQEDYFNKYIEKNEIKITELPAFADNYTDLENILKKFFNIEISQRNIQRIFYNEVEPLKTIAEFINDNYIPGKTSVSKKTGSTKTNETTGNLEKSNLKLYDELKLANRFKDEEISYIISALRRIIDDLGKKHFIAAEKDIEIKKDNNELNIKINLRQEH